MKEQKVLRILIPLLVLALLGLVALQVALLRNVYEQKEVAFDRNVVSALHAVTRALETREVQSKVLHMMGGLPRKRNVVVSAVSDSAASFEFHDEPSTGSFRFKLMSPPPVIDSICISNDTITFTHKLAVANLPGETTIDDTIIDRRYRNPVLRRRHTSMERSGDPEKNDSFWYYSEQIEELTKPLSQDAVSPLRRQELMAQAMDVVYISQGKPVEHSITTPVLDSLIRTNLAESGIDLPYAFGIAGESQDSLRLVSDREYYNELRDSKLKAGLFTGDLMGGVHSLALYFPDRGFFILRQMAPSLVATALFVLIILASFGYTVNVIYRQKRFHGLLSEFINNMTHEFKTPISTISVVTDTLTLPNVVGEKEKILHYNKIIQDEIGRMKGHVDKILQMAVLEEGDYELKFSDIDAHDILREAADKIALRVEQRGGTMSTELVAANHIVRCDAFHLTNVIYNLLDNAEKYSPERPEIVLRTENREATIVISVKDHGIGIPENDQRHVFDKYYRVSTGNVHDVKGFGLGLCYVKLMVEAQHGSIGLYSTPGSGTTISIQFPVKG